MISRTPSQDRLEFWTRCKKLYAERGSPSLGELKLYGEPVRGDAIYVRDSGFTFRIAVRVNGRFGVSFQVEKGGSVLHLPETDPADSPDTVRLIGLALPVLRKIMVLDDLANA